jgi:predicted permease
VPRQPWREVDDELRFHLDMRIRDYLARGYTRDEAERAARERFGDVEHVRRTLQSHDARRERMSRLWQDARLALRGFRRTPTFFVTAVLILGLGIGMATAMWAVFHAVLVRPLPVVGEDRIVLPRILDAAGVDVAITPPELEQVRRSSRTMVTMGAVAHWGAGSGPLMLGDQPIVLAQAQVMGNFFEVLGARPVIGRLLRAEDDSTSHVVVLSYEAWQSKFGGDPSVIGSHLTEPYREFALTIVGVAPPGLDYPAGAECWLPMYFSYYVDAIGRLAPGATLAGARAEFSSAMRQIRPSSIAVQSDARTLRTAMVGDVRQIVIVLTAAVGLLLLIVCVNVGNLLLLRATARARELAVRRALGATYADVFWQLVVESTLLGAAGGALGLVVAEVARRVLIAAAPRELPGLDLLRVGGAPIVAVIAVALLTVLIFGVAPAMVVGHGSSTLLRHDRRSGSGTRQRRRLRQLLVASQVALALIVLAGAGLLAKSLSRLETLKLGYATDHLSLLQLTFPVSRLDSLHSLNDFYDGLAPRLRALPAVTAITPVEIPPFIGANVWSGPLEIEGQPSAQTGSKPLVALDVGGAEYFRTLGTPILHGRGFVAQDREHAPMVAIVSEAIARMYWPNEDPIGKRVRFEGDTVWRAVVGVAGDIHYRSLREVTPTVFLPWRQYYWQGVIAIRTTASLNALLPAIQHAITGADPDIKVWRAQTMDELLGGPLAEPRLTALLLSTFGLVALALAAIGLYGVMASAVREQTRDIGVRMALGATPQRVRAEVLRTALAVSLAGAAVGLAGALVFSRIIASLLFQVSPTDPVALTGACAVLLGVALIAAYLPARHASQVDPARALQAE